MNARIYISAALVMGTAMGLFFNHMVPSAHAQAQPPPASPNLELKMLRLETEVSSLQQQTNALQAEVNLLKVSNSTAASSDRSPFYRLEPAPRHSNIPPTQITLLGQTGR